MLRVEVPNQSHSCNEGNVSEDFYQCQTVFLKAGVNYVWFVLLTHFICVFNYLLIIEYNNPWYIWNKIINDYRRFLLNKNSRMQLSQRQGGKKEHIRIKYNGTLRNIPERNIYTKLQWFCPVYCVKIAEW